MQKGLEDNGTPRKTQEIKHPFYLALDFFEGGGGGDGLCAAVHVHMTYAV